MKRVISAMALAISLVSSLAFANPVGPFRTDTSSADEASRGSVYFQPCNNWTYQNGDYVCQWLGNYLDVYDSRSVDQLINTLERRIDALEERVRQLEAAPR